VRSVAYHFPSFQALAILLEAGGDEQDLELPPGVTGRDAEWVTAVFSVGGESTSISACIVDRGYGLRLAFEDRDWQQLWHFANSGDPPSMPPPSSLPPLVEQPRAMPVTRVLLVEPDPQAQRVLVSLIEEAGHVATVASTAEEAFQRLRDLAVDLAVLEWVLPGGSGLDLCKRIRQDGRLGGLPVVFVTRRGTPADVLAGFEAGADDYLVKPCRPLELRARLAALLRRSRAMPYAPR